LTREPKELRRAVALEVWGNRYAVRALEEISRAYREMLVEMVSYAVRYRASLKTLHRMFYNKYRSRYPWLPTRVVKGCLQERPVDQSRAPRETAYKRCVTGSLKGGLGYIGAYKARGIVGVAVPMEPSGRGWVYAIASGIPCGQRFHTARV